MNTASQILASGIALGIPILVAAVGETFSERAGVINLQIEGSMLLGAFVGVIGGRWTGSPWAGLLCGTLAGILLATIQGTVVLRLDGDQIVSAVGLNLLCLGLTSYLLDSVYGGVSIKSPGFNPVAIPVLNKLPLVGDALFNQSLPVYGALILAPFASRMMFHTYWGLKIRACGDGPRAADAAGVNVARTRFEAMLLAGALAGGAGTILALSTLNFFSEDITQGAGYIGLAAVLLGGWRPGRVALAALLFGTMSALNFTAQATGIGITPDVLVTLPYIAPLLILAAPITGMKTPLYLGVPYHRGTRA